MRYIRIEKQSENPSENPSQNPSIRNTYFRRTGVRAVARGGLRILVEPSRLLVVPSRHWGLTHAVRGPGARRQSNHKELKIFLCAGMVPPADCFSSQAEIGFLLPSQSPSAGEGLEFLEEISKSRFRFLNPDFLIIRGGVG